MGKKRQSEISRSIYRALLRDPHHVHKKTVLAFILAFFTIWRIRLVRLSAELFRQLRTEVWNIDEEEYKRSFHCEKGQGRVEPMGDLGYSGSTFFRTANSKFLIKSLPRHFEHSFFEEELLQPYSDYMSSHPDSLLVRITDFLVAPYCTLGAMLKFVPTHHVIMENVLCDRQAEREGDKWETYDLKPIDYFYPKRDLLPESLRSESVMRKPFDVFNDKIRITREQYSDLRQMIEEDTGFLQSANTVDYSLFLVRFPAHLQPGNTNVRTSQWRAGVPSTDGKWKYRTVLLDFFWAKHTLHAQALTTIVQTFNVVGRKGPMTITTTAEEYRRKFLQMIDGLVELQTTT